MLFAFPNAATAGEVILPQLELTEEVAEGRVVLAYVKDGKTVELDRIIKIAERMWKSAKNDNLYYTKIRTSDTPQTLFSLYEDFAKTNNRVWVYKYDHEGVSKQEKAKRRIKQFNDFHRAGGLESLAGVKSSRWMRLSLKSYHDALVEPDSDFIRFSPLRQKLEGTGLLLENGKSPLAKLMAADEAMEVSKVDFSLNLGGRSWEWKLAKPLVAQKINGLDMVAFDTKPYFDSVSPEKGGDVHGVSGGLTKQYDGDSRPDIRAATHYVFYVANTGPEDFYISIEFYDYDPALDPDRDGYSNNLNHLGRDFDNETEEQYLLRYDKTFMQAGFEQNLLIASGGLVDEYEYQKHRYDSYRFREFGVDGPKAQKLRIVASPEGNPLLYRVAIPVTADFMQKYYINTGIGDGLVNIGRHDLQRIQYVFYVTED